MSFNNTGMGSTSSLEEILVHSNLISLMLSHTFLILLFPLLFSLFHFSTPQGRRRPVFVLNILATVLAFIVGVLIDVMSVRGILEPANPLPLSLNIAIGFLGVWQSIFVDLILLVRLIAVYPLMFLGLKRFSLLISTPVLLKLARVVNLCLFTNAEVKATMNADPIVVTNLVFKTTPYLKIEWAAQMIDNTYASLTFLWAIRDQGNGRVATSSSTVTLAQRMRTLSRIALTNFVVPTMFSIAQFVCAYHGVDVATLEQLMLVNLMLATFGVAFATMWAGKASRGAVTQGSTSKGGDDLSDLSPVFAKGYLEAAERSHASGSSA